MTVQIKRTGKVNQLLGLTLLVLALLLAIIPFAAQGQTSVATIVPTATVDTAFVEECRRKLQEVMHYKAEVDAGNEHPSAHLDDAVYNFENFGCDWDMFSATPTPVPTAVPVVTTDAGQTTPVPAVEPGTVVTVVDSAFLEECRQKLQLVQHHLAEVNAGSENPLDHLDDAIYNFENYGCTWDMFDTVVTPTVAVTTTVATTVATTVPVATTDPALIPTATVDTTFMDECRRRLQQVQHYQAEVNAGNESPHDHLDDVINNFLGYGCTWAMFE